MFIKGSSKYILKATGYKEPPVDFSLSTQFGLGQNTSLILEMDQIKYNPDGSFEVYISNVNDRNAPNFLQTQPTTILILIRDTLSDTGNQYPYNVTVQTVSNPEVPIQQVVSQLSQLISPTLASKISGVLQSKLPEQIVLQQLLAPEIQAPASNAILNIFLQLIIQLQKGAVNQPPNTFQQPIKPSGLGTLTTQLVSNGTFNITSDQALIVTINLGTSEYFSISATNFWTITGNYFNTTNSLNNFQAKADSKGVYTFVLSIKDPMVYNWVDTNGLSFGTLYIRWQVNKGGGQKISSELVQLSDVKLKLPGNTYYVTQAQRTEQLQSRYIDFSWRQGGEGTFTAKAF